MEQVICSKSHVCGYGICKHFGFHSTKVTCSFGFCPRISEDVRCLVRKRAFSKIEVKV